LIAVFEPRSATSRRKIFQRDYVAAFERADSLFVALPYDQSRIATEEQFSSEQLVADLKTRGVAAEVMKTVEEGVASLVHTSRSGDVIAVLSNGGFGGFIPKLLSALESR
jgi:UDP-N-acetylmuramate: L-alanyl-gamma-D-glutamyl-meso-diaminopimelate ligase